MGSVQTDLVLLKEVHDVVFCRSTRLFGTESQFGGKEVAFAEAISSVKLDLTVDDVATG